jgi:S-DNA-T family DNA segregation ATPase FtsK/SpoIIIE
LSLLDGAPSRESPVGDDALEYTARLIEKKLLDFGVEVKVEAIHPGPVITRFEIEPAVGVKGAAIVGLMRDLARALSVRAIRVLETIPGSTRMGLEIPNARRETVYLSEVLASAAYTKSKTPLALALGKDVAGRPFVVDLARMPHLLVAGTTGAGKSVSLNAMLLSLLYKAQPADARLILIDPKMLELSVYRDIPHLLAPVVVDMNEAHIALNWCVAEMERRYRLMAAAEARNVEGFNQKIAAAKEAGAPMLATPAIIAAVGGEENAPLEKLPYIVVVIDELADLMMVAGKKIEQAISRLAQKARAAGIHLLLATQRPSVDVITGLIKANIASRIAFQVSSKVDSRTILDQGGAESLLGKGDMLFTQPSLPAPERVHGAFVSDGEVARVAAYLKEKLPPPADSVDFTDAEQMAAISAPSANGGAIAEGESDPLYDQAVEVVLETRRASISLVQRKLRIGYNRAARMIEEMEKARLVSPMDETGARKVIPPPKAGEA